MCVYLDSICEICWDRCFVNRVTNVEPTRGNPYDELFLKVNQNQTWMHCHFFHGVFSRCFQKFDKFYVHGINSYITVIVGLYNLNNCLPCDAMLSTVNAVVCVCVCVCVCDWHTPVLYQNG